MDILLLLYLILIVAPIGSIVHELGHALGARILSANHVILSIGTGKKLFHYSCKYLDVAIHPIYFIGGHSYSERGNPYKNHELIWISICGPISNGLFSLLFFYVYNLFPNSYIQLLILFNLWLALVNMIPFQFNGKQSDGYTVFKRILKK
ncbi:M50 family metallopeptidase [Virgibacillus byunsanensis]|uniref:M50 family metallopeptidase n=1 Tax=Virgibacillus byunsanensis TaxID=570945 RepID=A0ABW3LLG5_9BACI